ncbi:MAG: hypothetical protein ACTSUC_01695 [Promethearchaeota archaeon]
MITENENGKPKGAFKPTRIPIILKMPEEWYELDSVLTQMKNAMIKNTPANREFAFYNDSIGQSMVEITSAVIIGNGPKIFCENKKALEIIENFNSEINVNGRTIEDYMRSVWFDEIVHADSYWRIDIDPKLYENRVDIQRIDPKTIIKLKDPKKGWRALIQSVPNYKSYRSEAQFYKNAYKDKLYLSPLQTHGTRGVRYKLDIVIPDKPNVILRTSYFIKPPVASIIHFITGKRFTFYFMRKFAQKRWAPPLIARIGDPNSNFYPDDPEQMKEAMDMVQKILPKFSNWGGAALPGIIDLKTLDTQSTKSAQIYRDAIELFNKEIMWGLYASMAQRDASGNEQSTQRGILDAFYSFLESMRRRFANTLTRFYSKCLLPVWGINDVKQKDISVSFDPLKRSGYLEIAQAIERLNNAGLFKDDNEARKAGSIVFAHLKALTEEENKPRGQKLMKEMNKSGFGESSQKNPQATRSTTTLENKIGSKILEMLRE